MEKFFKRYWPIVVTSVITYISVGFILRKIVFFPDDEIKYLFIIIGGFTWIPIVVFEYVLPMIINDIKRLKRRYFQKTNDVTK